MLVKNPKTNEIGEIAIVGSFAKVTTEDAVYTYTSLHELYDDWSDYVDLNDDLTINPNGDIDFGGHHLDPGEIKQAFERHFVVKRLIKHHLTIRSTNRDFNADTEEVSGNFDYTVDSYPQVSTDLDIMFGVKS